VSRVLFVMLHPGYVRYFEHGIRALADAGHAVHVAFEVTREKLNESDAAGRLATLTPLVTCGPAPDRTESVREFLARGDRAATRAGEPRRRVDAEAAWSSFATTVRLMEDYLRFFDPAFAGAGALRARAEKRLPRLYRPIVRAAALAGGGGRRLLARLLEATERLIPTTPSIDEFLRQNSPDLVVVTPLVELGSQQVDYVKSARRLGVRSALSVASWDNLTSKGLIRVLPDHVIVWNDAQRAEAAALHRVPADRIVITGAQLFDDWFEAQPSRSREAFCRDVGLDPEKPFVLYVGSSSFIAPEEVPFVERWLSRLRRAPGEAVRSAGVLVRPHPANSRQWRAFDPSSFAQTALWPALGADPNAPQARRDYVDSLWHCAAVVGINTSAQIEAAIVGRPVFTIRDAGFAHAQEGTLHFRHLIEGGGPVRVADTLDAHVAQLAEFLERGHGSAERARGFVETFVRPHGLDRRAAPIYASSVAELCALPRRVPEADPWWVLVWRPVALLEARLAHLLAEDRPVWVYLLRPFLAAAVWAMAALHGPGHGWLSLASLGVKRARRAGWRVWYESSRALEQMLGRVRKPMLRGARYAGRVARRMVGRQA
jgi:hypothetical protein